MNITRPLQTQVRTIGKDRAKGQDVIAASPIPVFGEVLPKLHLEAVVRYDKADSLQLHVRKGTRFYTSPQINVDGRIYVPREKINGLMQGVRFPPPASNSVHPAS